MLTVVILSVLGGVLLLILILAIAIKPGSIGWNRIGLFDSSPKDEE